MQGNFREFICWFSGKIKPVPFQLSRCNIINRSIHNTWIPETDEDRNKFLDLPVKQKANKKISVCHWAIMSKTCKNRSVKDEGIHDNSVCGDDYRWSGLSFTAHRAALRRLRLRHLQLN
jgi:hypothetical protein